VKFTEEWSYVFWRPGRENLWKRRKCNKPVESERQVKTDSDVSPSPHHPPKKELNRQKFRKINSINKSLECGSRFTTNSILGNAFRLLTLRQAKECNIALILQCCFIIFKEWPRLCIILESIISSNDTSTFIVNNVVKQNTKSRRPIVCGSYNLWLVNGKE